MLVVAQVHIVVQSTKTVDVCNKRNQGQLLIDKDSRINKSNDICNSFLWIFSYIFIDWSLLSSFSKSTAVVNTPLVDILIARLTHYWFIISNEGQRKRRSGSVERDLCQQMLYFNCQTPIEGLNLNNGFLEIKSCPSVTLSKLDLTSEIWIRTENTEWLQVSFGHIQFQVDQFANETLATSAPVFVKETSFCPFFVQPT